MQWAEWKRGWHYCRACFFAAAGCGQDLPFEYRYLSPGKVQIKYTDRIYSLHRYDSAKVTPFEYAFEPDGDLDVTFAGKPYEIESLYDVDRPGKKVTTRKRKTTGSKRR